jgi:putative hydrolase of the HAD superfamily
VQAYDAAMPETLPITAVLWDFGGVIVSSPFDAFAEYEARRGLPVGFIRSVNAANHHANAWARLERSDITVDEFDVAFAAESEHLGHRVRGADVLALLEGEIRPEMVDLLDRVNAAGFRTACLTNNITRSGTSARDAAVSDVMRRFELVVESSKVGVRKPEPRFYEVACELLGVEPAACLFLDDLGINLKPAAAMGMRTIKVIDPATAIAEVERLLSL